MGDPAVIAESWRRSTLHGLDPSVSLKNMPAYDVDVDGPLMSAARPVLDDFAVSLAGSGYSFILGDREARVLHRFGETPAARAVLLERSVEIGVSFSESAVGTNALGTALELRSPVAVDHHDHFVEELQLFSCLGHPIIHPITRRAVGVLDLTGTEDVSHPVIRAMMQRVVRDIEGRLLEASRSSSRELQERFLTASRRRGVPVVAVGDDTLLANRHALDLFRGDDLAILRSLAPASVGQRRSRSVNVTLSSGDEVSLVIDQAGGGSIMTLAPTGERARAADLSVTDVEPSSPGGPARVAPSTLISGPPGSGRSTRAQEIADGRPLIVIGAAAGLEKDGRPWVQALTSALRSGPEDRVVCLEDIEVLPDRLLTVAVEAAEDVDRPELVVVSDSIDNLTGRAAVLASMCMQRISVSPLSQRRDEIHLLAVRMLLEIQPEIEVRLTPTVLEALSAHHWPGNFHELRSVLTHVAQRRSTGDVILTDLPERYRSTSPGRQLSALERAEADAIMRALATTGGNKSQAARILGISRTTLYAHMRQLRISG